MAAIVLSTAALLAPGTARAGAACGCSLSSDAAAGYQTVPGWRADLQYTYIDQSQLRAGTSAITPGRIGAVNDRGGGQEVEHRTTNQYVTLGLSYSPDGDWSVAAQIPYVDRLHSTFGAAGSSQINAASQSNVSFGDLGDVRVLGAYQGFLPDGNLAVQLGVKLPTGRFGGQNTVTGAVVGRNPALFSSGPGAASGQVLDASLQPGTGSTDIIIGASYDQPVSEDIDAFVNGRIEVAVAQFLANANANYRPGNTGVLSFGLRDQHSPVWAPQLQINITRKSADQGALADTANTAGTVIYASPGLSLRLAEGVTAFGFVQIPVHSWLAGYQLFPRWTANAGLSYAF
ncbi:MAG: transporter [Telmatospirillum sp.]|nr:transporter [Telmatospirillum sp.]